MRDVSWKQIIGGIVESMTDSLDEPDDRLSFSDQASILGLRKLLIDEQSITNRTPLTLN